MNMESLFAEDKEWLAQKMKVVDLKEKLDKAVETWYGMSKEDLRFNQIKKIVYDYDSRLFKARVELSKIEKRIRDEYDLRNLAIMLDYMDDEYYEKKLDVDGYLSGIKF